MFVFGALQAFRSMTATAATELLLARSSLDSIKGGSFQESQASNLQQYEGFHVERAWIVDTPSRSQRLPLGGYCDGMVYVYSYVRWSAENQKNQAFSRFAGRKLRSPKPILGWPEGFGEYHPLYIYYFEESFLVSLNFPGSVVTLTEREARFGSHANVGTSSQSYISMLPTEPLLREVRLHTTMLLSKRPNASTNPHLFYKILHMETILHAMPVETRTDDPTF